MSVCTKFQVDSSNTFGVKLWKANLTLLTSVTLKMKVTTPTSIGFLNAIKRDLRKLEQTKNDSGLTVHKEMFKVAAKEYCKSKTKSKIEY